jgi:hypothetical protein
MREERGQIAGDIIVHEKYELWGHVGGNVTVVSGGKFYLRGAIYGNLILDDGGRVHIFGQIKGNVTLKANTKVIHSGVIGGDIVNSGGRLYIEKVAKTGGKVKTRHGGETKYEGASSVAPDEKPERPPREDLHY